MDPQQRLMLKVAHRALESSGYAPDSTKTFAKETFACYIAVATSDYVENLREDIDVYYLPGKGVLFRSDRSCIRFPANLIIRDSPSIPEWQDFLLLQLERSKYDC